MKLTFKIILPLFILVVIILLGLSWFSGDFDKEELEISCSPEVEKSIKSGRYAGFGPSNDIELIACYGVVAEEMWTEIENGFSLYDHKNKYEVVPLVRQGHYQLSSDKILVFVVDGRPKDLSSYAVWYFVDGQEKLFTYKLYDNIPRYIAINIHDGEITLYPNNLDEIPETERKIFQELENL